MEYREFDQSVTFLHYYFEPRLIDVCKEFYFQLSPVRQFFRGPYKKHLSEIVLKLDQWFRRRCH